MSSLSIYYIHIQKRVTDVSKWVQWFGMGLSVSPTGEGAESLFPSVILGGSGTFKM